MKPRRQKEIEENGTVQCLSSIQDFESVFTVIRPLWIELSYGKPHLLMTDS